MVIRKTDSQYHEKLFIRDGRIISSHCGYVKWLNTVTTKETVCEGDSGGPAFSYLQDLSTVSLIGITIEKVQDLNEFIPLDVILNKSGLELPRVVRDN
ncbi:hypothetical protein F8M41_010175 [Gigaspora margarita]|uniref:Peptidase S1 domain-containing protein n=1 Tax=Gigaspora margarita TaxID=4874 RepID=A0A8H4AUK5_GIGMA|nr:hypothetical protein F8M41_010175 [Gigaspora margarita]